MNVIDAQNQSFGEFALNSSIPLNRVRTDVRTGIDVVGVESGDTDVGRIRAKDVLLGCLVFRLDRVDLDCGLTNRLTQDRRDRSSVRGLSDNSEARKRNAALTLNRLGHVQSRNWRLDGLCTSVGGVVEDAALVEDTDAATDRGLVISGAEVEY